MVLGLSIYAFTVVHVVLSLIAIAVGFVAVIGMARGLALPRWTALFLLTTALTTITGFMFPFGGVTPAFVTGLVSTVFILIALLALYGRRLDRSWRWIYIVAALVAFWLNVFVSIVQTFQKIGFFRALAPTQSEPPFLIAQLAALAVVVVLGYLAVRRFRPGMPVAVTA